jgi:hypothetical protein
MDSIRAAGLFISICLALYFFVFSKKRSRGENLLALIIIAGIATLSIDPASANFLTSLLQLRNRLFAVLVFSNLLLFVLFLFLLRRSNTTRNEISHLVRMLARTEYQRFHETTDHQPKILVIIPAYKEEESIKDVLSRLPAALSGYALDPVVVVDGNYDNTERVVRGMGYRVATHITNRGQGGALITGFEIAIHEGAQIVVTMDADGQHDVADLPRLLAPILNDDADYVMGSRFLGEYEDRGGARHLGIVVFSRLISLLARTRITDCTNGYRAIRTSKLALLSLSEERFNAPELIIQASRNRLRIKEVPVTIRTRAVGESKKPRRLGYPIGFGLAMLRAWLR